MRAQARKSFEEEEEESAFVSMTDMTVGFLFIVMILLAFFASQFQQENRNTVPKVKYLAEQKLRLEAEKSRDALKVENAQQALRIETLLALIDKLKAEKAKLTSQNVQLEKRIKELEAKVAELEKKLRDPLELYLAKVSSTRRQILLSLQAGLKADFPDLQVVLNAQGDALRFQGEGLFESGKAALKPGKQKVIDSIAGRLDQILPCYTFRPDHSRPAGCNSDDAVIEAVQIEGHTDAQGGYPYNIDLSAKRATQTFQVMLRKVPELRDFKNMRNQSVMSFAGYGPDRPIATNDTPAGRATNRRIDLRLIMVMPVSMEGVQSIRRRFASIAEETR